MLPGEQIQSSNKLQIKTERVDDIVFLLGMMKRMG